MPPPSVSKAGKTPEHHWDKAPYSWHRWGKFESLSEALLFPVPSILQLGFQLVPLSLGTISHLSSLPQHSASCPGARLETRPACIPSAAGNGLGRQRHVPALLHAGEIPLIRCPESSSDLWMEVTILAWLFLGQEGRLSLFPVQTPLFDRL